MLNFGASKPRVKGGPPGSAPGSRKSRISLLLEGCATHVSLIKETENTESVELFTCVQMLLI